MAGAVSRRKPPSLRNIGIDLDRRAPQRFRGEYPVASIDGDAYQLLREYPFEDRELVYCDPPYLHATRSSARRYRFDYAEHEHIALLRLLRSLPCAVMLSGYPEGSLLLRHILRSLVSLMSVLPNQTLQTTPKNCAGERERQPPRLHRAP